MNAKPIISLVVFIMVVTIVAIPILANTNHIEVDENSTEDLIRFSVYDGATLNLGFNGTNITINGEVSAAPLISTNYYISKSVVDFVTGTVVNWTTDDTMTIDDGQVSGTGGMSVFTTPLGADAVYADTDGDLVRAKDGVYVGDNVKIYLSNASSPSYFGVGTIEEIVTGHAGNFTTSGVTAVDVSNISVDSTAENGTNLVESVSLTVADDQHGIYIYVPIEYTKYSDGGVAGQITDMIPVLLVISLLVAAVAALVRRS